VFTIRANAQSLPTYLFFKIILHHPLQKLNILHFSRDVDDEVGAGGEIWGLRVEVGAKS